MLEGGRKHETDRSEVMRMVIRSSYKHNSENVVGAPMASYLTRTDNKSRFYHSHNSVWLPLSDMAKTLCGNEPSAKINYYDGMRIVEFACRHYLCRPKRLENTSFFDFTRDYTIAFVPKDPADKSVTPFINTKHFKHPSYCDAKQRMRQGIKERVTEQRILIKVFQGLFPDSAQFKGSIFEAATQESKTTNDYAFLVLMMFAPFRSLEDFTEKASISYTAKLRKIYAAGNVLKEEHFTFLQNLQDIKHNYLRYGRPHDELESRTHIYTGPDSSGEDVMGNDDDDAVPDEFGMDPEAAAFMDKLMEQQEAGENDDSNKPHPDSISFAKIKDRQKDQDATRVTPGAPKRNARQDELENFVQLQSGNRNDQNASNASQTNTLNYEEPPRDPRKRDIIKLYIKKQRVNVSLPTAKDKEEETELPEPNGMASTINEWAHKAKLDRDRGELSRTF